MIKYILFDLDGTLTESAPGIIRSVKYALARMGIEDYDEDTLCKFIGPPLLESFEEHFGMNEQQAQRAVGIYREYFSEKGLFENAVYGGVRECLKRLKEAGLRLAVATSKPQVFCDRILEHFGLTEYFEVIVGVPLGDLKMTKTKVIAEALSRLGVVNKAEAVMAGDRFYDVEGALENGIGCIGVSYGYGSVEELLSAGAQKICGSAEELVAAILEKI